MGTRPQPVPGHTWSRRSVLVTATSALVAAGTVTLGQGAARAADTPLEGFATQNGGTTGGAGGSTVTVTTVSALKSALASGSALVIRVSGIISGSGMLDVASNKSVLGVGSGSGLSGLGLNVTNAHNVIIRNLRLSNATDDSINVQYSTNVWIDHNDLSNGYDGLCDIKRASDFVTVSWNHFHNHDKTCLLGHSDSNSSEDTGHLRVTYHHNWFDGTVQRHPRVRFSPLAHVYNNYYNNNSGYGVASTCNAMVLVERNYFENVADPAVTATGSSPSGNLRAVNNYLVGSGTVATRNASSVPAPPYGYSPTANSSVKSVVTAGAGVGRIGL